MFKFSAAFLLFAAAVFWSSAQQALGKSQPELDVISKGETYEGTSGYRVNIFTLYGLGMMTDLAEPSKRLLLKEKLMETADRTWKNYDEYVTYIVNLFQEVGGVDITEFVHITAPSST